MENMKIVDFENWCEICKHSDKLDTEEPCNECLHMPARPNSHRPEKYQEK